MTTTTRQRGPRAGELARMLADRAPALAAALFAAGVREGPEFRVGSLAGEAGRSMAIHMQGQKAGVWADFSTGETGDALDLVAWALYSGNKAHAVAWAKDWLGIGEFGHPIPTRPAVIEKEPEPEPSATNGPLALWLGAEPSIMGTPAEAYLESRGISFRQLGRQPRCLRYHPRLWNVESGRHWPALLAAVICGGAHVATHRTWLQPDGSGKAPLRDPKMTYGRYGGGCIPLWRGASGKPLAQALKGEDILLSEGIEDGASGVMARPDLRTLVGVSLSAMGSLVLPKAIATVRLLAQNDTAPAAIRGRERAIRNLQAQGKRVLLVFSPVGKDINDLLMHRRETAA